MAEQTNDFERLAKKIILVFLLLASADIITAKETCKPGVTYWDSSTDRCDPCRDKCDPTIVEGQSRDECDRLCPGSDQGYWKSGPTSKSFLPSRKNCPPDEFYDVHVDRCEKCVDECRDPTSTECQQHCADWLTKTTTTSPTPSELRTAQKRLLPLNNDGSSASPIEYKEKKGLSVLHMFLIGVGAAVCVIGILLAIIFRKRLVGCFRTRQCSTLKRPKQVINGNDQESYPMDGIFPRQQDGDPQSLQPLV